MDFIQDANLLLEISLENKPERLVHSKSVFDNTLSILSGTPDLKKYNDSFKEHCLASALLHDIGYSDKATQFGFHPVDGYLFLKNHGWSKTICTAVLYHSWSKELADMLDNSLLTTFYASQLTEEEKLIIEIISFADMHISPSGEKCTFGSRIQNIGSRFGENSIQFKHISKQEEHLLNLQKKFFFK